MNEKLTKQLFLFCVYGILYCMAYLELQNYIIEQEKKGVSRAQLREVLITRGGWREDIVMNAFMAIDAAKQTPPLAPSTASPLSSPSGVDAIRPAVAPVLEQTINTATRISTPTEQQNTQITPGMSPVQAQDKMNILDSLYNARAGVAPVSQSLQQTPSAVAATQSTQPFMGMPGMSVQPTTRPGGSFLKRLIMILIGFGIVGTIAFGAWYAYGYFIKPVPSRVFDQVTKHIELQQKIPFHVAISLQGVKSETDSSSVATGEQVFDTTGTYDTTKNSFIGKLSLKNENKVMYGLLYSKEGSQITIAPDTDSESVKTIPTTNGITFDASNIDLARSYFEKTYAHDVRPSWAAFDAIQPIIEKILPHADEIVGYAMSLPDVTEQGSRMRHFLLGQDQIQGLPENIKPFISSVRAQIKEVEVWTTWYPEKIQKVHLVVVSKDETSMWQTADITITFPLNEEVIKLPETTTNLQAYLEDLQIQEAKKQQDTFFSVAFNQADLYKSTKNTLKGFCTSNSGLAELFVGGGVYTADTVSCKEAVQGVSITLKDPNNPAQFVCRDVTTTEPVVLTAKPLTAVCK